MLIAERIALAALGLGLCVCFAVAIKFPVPRISEQVLTEVNGIVKGDFEYNGRKVHYESFDPKVPSVSKDYKKLGRNLVSDMNPLIDNIVYDAIVNRRSSIGIGISYGGKLFGLIRKNLNAFSKLPKSYETTATPLGFMNHYINFLKGIMSKSYSATPPALKPVEFVISAHELLDILRPIADKSPVSLYINLNNFTINGQPAQLIAAAHVAYVRETGYGMVLKLADYAISFIASWAARNSPNPEN